MHDGKSLLVVDDQLPVLHLVTERRQAAHPHTLLFGSCNLVADSFAGDFTLELGKRQEDVQGQSSHARGCVELLGYRNERDTLCVEGFHDLGEIEQRARQPVDFIDHHHVDLAGANISEEPLEGRALHRPARKAAVVIQARQDRPAFVLLGENEGCASFALSVERVERLLQTFLRGLSGVDRAAHSSGRASRRLF